MSSRPTGLLLVNLGTPAAPTPEAVRAYLAEFLSDPRVIDIPALARTLLLNFVILPRRSPASAALYRKVWTPEGSPLLVHSRALLGAVRPRLEGVPVELGMRYGEPSIGTALRALDEAGCSRITVFPLYPQFATSSTGSTQAKALDEASRLQRLPVLDFVPPFFADERFIAAWAAVARPALDAARADHVLFSFHGLPERHIRALDTFAAGGAGGRWCFATDGCCAAMRDENRHCYRAQCYATAASIARAVEIPADRFSVSFQSRLGRTPWIRPYTDLVLPELQKRGIARVAVVCPSFVADCLETLEEIGIRAREQWLALGGEELTLVPSLNATPSWVDAVVELAQGLRSLAPFRIAP